MITKPWTDGQVAKLRAYAQEGISSKVAAKRLRRSYGATRFKAKVEGIRFHSLGRAHSRMQKARWGNK